MNLSETLNQQLDAANKELKENTEMLAELKKVYERDKTALMLTRKVLTSVINDIERKIKKLEGE